MKYILKYTFFLLGIALVSSCADSEVLSPSDYSYTDINEVSIATNETKFSIVQFDSLKITPILTESKSIGDTYNYEWKVLGKESTTVISTERDLNVKISIAPGTYNLQYTVINASTGLKSSRLFDLNVNSSFHSGWLVSHNKTNNGTLSFIRTDGVVFESPAVDANNKTFAGKALTAYYSLLQNQPNYASILYFTTDGVYRFDPNNFALVGDTQSILPYVNGFVEPVYTISSIGTDQYIIDQGNLYAGIGIFHPAEIFKPFSSRIEGDYSLYKNALIATSLTTYFYDNKYKRFMTMMYNTRALNVAVRNANHVFDMSNVGKTMVAADIGAKVRNDAQIYCVMDDATGRFLLSLNGAIPKYNQKVLDANTPNFSKAALFSTTGTALEHMYYAFENKIYLYDIANNKGDLIYQFPQGENVTSLVIDKSTGKSLAVGTLHNNQGSVYLFDINTLGWFANDTFKSSFKGFGEIAHLSKK